jgi:hypothetical protein
MFSSHLWTARHNPFPSNLWVTPFKLSAIWSVFFNQICHLTTFKQKRINSRFLFLLHIYRLLNLVPHSSTNMNINLSSTTYCSLVEILLAGGGGRGSQRERDVVFLGWPMSPNTGGGGEGCGGLSSANENSCGHGAQIKFRDLTPYLTYDY